jgi:hypothetical protein
MNQYDKTLKEWNAMLSYVSGTYKGTIKALSKENGIDYNRCIRMNKSLKKKANKVEYVNSLIKKYTVLRDSVAEPVIAEPVIAEPVIAEPVIAEPVIAEPVVAEPVVAEPVIAEVPVNLIESPSSHKLDVPEYITKKEFDNYIKTLNATLDLIIETQKYSDVLTTILLVIISIFSIFACVNLSFH